MEHKLLRCRQKGDAHEHLSDKELRQHIQQVDRHRASYYKHCTDRNWGDRANDDLCINTGTESVKDRPSPGAVYEAWR